MIAAPAAASCCETRPRLINDRADFCSHIILCPVKLPIFICRDTVERAFNKTLTDVQYYTDEPQ